MAKRGSIYSHPSARSSAAALGLGLNFTGYWLLATILCSATAAAPQRIMLQIKGFAIKTPPVPRGTPAAPFAENKFLLKRRGGQLSQPHQKTYLNLPKYAGLEG